MTEIEPTAASRRSIRPGGWFGIFGDQASVLLPPSEKRRVAALWELVDDGAGFDEVLDALLAHGLRDLPGFVLLSETAGPVKIVLRGPVRATFWTEDDEITLDGSVAATWVERSLDGVVRSVIEVEEAPEGSELTVAAGLVRVARVDDPPVDTESKVGDVPAPAPTPSPVPLPADEAVGRPVEEPADGVDEVDIDSEDSTGLEDESEAEPEPTVEPEVLPEPAIEPEPAPASYEEETVAFDVVDQQVADLPEPEPAPAPSVEPEVHPDPAAPAPFAWDRPPVAPVARVVPPVVPPVTPPLVEPDSQSDGQPDGQPAGGHDGMTGAAEWDDHDFDRRPPGIPGQQQAPSVVSRPVARLVISSGESIEVDRAVIVGRAPEARRFSSSEQPRLVTVPSPHQEISSTHLEIRPGSGADHGSAVVTDLGSTNGSVLVQPGLPPEDLQPGIAVQLIPGAIIDLGDGVTIQVTNP
ncbi:MAG: FHA domain-containing protein [Nocardioides sp.]